MKNLNMKKYLSTRVRLALVITAVESSQKFLTVVQEVPEEKLTDEQKASNEIATEEQRVRVPDNFFGRGIPAVGDYYLVYLDDDGYPDYSSWCPKDVFERSNQLVGEGGDATTGGDGELKAELSDTKEALSKLESELATTKGELEQSSVKVNTLTDENKELASQNEKLAKDLEAANKAAKAKTSK